MARFRELLRWQTAATVLGYLLGIALVAAPLALEQSLENVRFADRLGTVPVEVSICHNGYSSLDTGILGTIYLRRTGSFGFGACVRATQPPEAGDTLSSYIDESFVQRNAELIEHPSEIASAYAHAFTRAFWHEFWRNEGVLGALGILVVIAFRRTTGSGIDDRLPWWGRRLGHRLAPWPRVRAVLWPTLVVIVGTTASAAYAGHEFRTWSGTASVGTTYALPQVSDLSFSSPQTREIAGQVQPFIQKNTERLKAEAEDYEDEAASTFEPALAATGDTLKPRDGEKIVLAEADPQGSNVGTAVRKRLYPMLEDQLGTDSIALRTISGDITSNGAVAESGFVKAEARSSGDITTVAVSGDHDSDRTVDQMKEYGMKNPDLKTIDVAGFRVSVANDPEYKTFFGGSVTNPSGVSEAQLGEKMREVVDPTEPGIVIFHQPDAAKAYLDISNINVLEGTLGHETTPWDDGIPDVPPGTVDVGHSHRSVGPFVLWNTDSGTTTWTVVDRLGTSGGAENSPTFNRFSTPFSVPLKPISFRIQYFDEKSGLQTGYATITVDLTGHATISERTDVGLPVTSVE
jgi:hypothetical protein